jgi:hypothetical protein
MSMSTNLVDSSTRVAMGATQLRGRSTIVIGFVGLMLIAWAAPMAHSQSANGALKDAPIDELKRVYLACDRAAISGELDTAGIMQCSIVYEELKRRAFGGNFDKLLAWSKTQPPLRITER